MKVQLKIPGKHGRMVLLRCKHCNQPEEFPSFRKAALKAKELGYEHNYNAIRVK